MRASIIGVLALLALAPPGAGGAQTGPKLAIGTIRGDASRVRRQILLQVCESYTCVAASKVTTNDKPDPQKMQRAGVVGYLGGAVTGEPGERRLILSLVTATTTAARPAHTWRLRLSPDGTLRAPVLDRFSTELDDALRGAAARMPSPAAPPQKAVPPPPPPQAAKPPPPPPPVAAKPAPPPPAAKPPPPPPAASAQAAEAPRSQPAAPAKQAAAHKPIRVAGELGLWITRRKLSYSGATAPTGSTPLRTYDASGIIAPAVRLELYPGAFMDASPLLAGIGLYGQYAQSVGLKVKPPSGSPAGESDGKLTAWDVGVVWRLAPVAGSAFVLAPAVGYRSLQLTTSPAIDGLPDTKPTGLEVRIDTEIPVSRTIALLAGGGYSLFSSAKDLVGDGFFGKGTARGFDLELGGAWRFHGPLSARAVLEYQAVSYTGLGDPAAGLGTASGANDKYLGGRLMLRGEY